MTDICVWSEYVNDFDEPMDFECPKNNDQLWTVVGASSYHDNNKEDRRWQFRYCMLSECPNVQCTLHGYSNDWDGDLDFTVPEKSYLTTITSEHNNDRE